MHCDDLYNKVHYDDKNMHLEPEIERVAVFLSFVLVSGIQLHVSIVSVVDVVMLVRTVRG